ncbi:MAG: hypothetical protein IJW24_00045 [Clostridia bacterium]|nr:hypothetical protein [Clostridia bacterium]
MLFVYNKFKSKKWTKYTPEKRHKVLTALEKKLAREQHRDPIPVVVHEDSRWNCYGMFVARGEDKKIYIHENLLLDPRMRFHALETIIHEGRHAMQYIKVTEQEPKWYEFKAKRWKENWQGYFSSAEDLTIYNNQEIERDAQKYTIKKLKRLAGKYRNERDFAFTLEANINRYENAELQAVKKYGPFARWRINRRVRKKAQKNNKH